MTHDEAVRRVGADHAEWFAEQSDAVRNRCIMGAWLCNDLKLMSAYKVIDDVARLKWVEENK